MDINHIELKLAEADAAIGAAKIAIVERLAAKGIKAEARTQTYIDGRPCFSITAHGAEPFHGYFGLAGYLTADGASFSDAFARAMREIDKVEDVRAYADDFAAPLFLMSEQHAQAAE
jgi:hypothetical protein